MPTDAAAEVTDKELEQGFALAYCLHPHGLVAAFVTAHAWRRSGKLQAVEEKRKRERGRASIKKPRPSPLEAGPYKGDIPAECRFQYCVYGASEPWEKNQEGPTPREPRYYPTMADYLVRYIKLLIWKAMDRKLHYVAAGLGCLLYTYSPEDIGTLVSDFLGGDSPTGSLDLKRIIKDCISIWAAQRFGGWPLDTRDPTPAEQALVDQVLRVFAPWGFSHIAAPPVKPSQVDSAWKALEQWREDLAAWGKTLGAWQGIHALIDPACGGLPRLFRAFNEVYTVKQDMQIDDLNGTLHIPLFQGGQPSDPEPPNRFKPPPFADHVQLIKGVYAEQQRRATQNRFKCLHVQVDGIDLKQFAPERSAGASFNVPLEAACLEVLGEDAEGDLLLAMFLLPELEADEECQLVTRLESGQTIQLTIWPVVHAETGEVSAFRLQLAYSGHLTLAVSTPPLALAAESAAVPAASLPLAQRLVLEDGHLLCTLYRNPRGQVVLEFRSDAPQLRGGGVRFTATHRTPHERPLSEAVMLQPDAQGILTGSVLLSERLDLHQGYELAFEPLPVPQRGT